MSAQYESAFQPDLIDPTVYAQTGRLLVAIVASGGAAPVRKDDPEGWNFRNIGNISSETIVEFDRSFEIVNANRTLFGLLKIFTESGIAVDWGHGPSLAELYIRTDILGQQDSPLSDDAARHEYYSNYSNLQGFFTFAAKPVIEYDMNHGTNRGSDSVDEGVVNSFAQMLGLGENYMEYHEINEGAEWDGNLSTTQAQVLNNLLAKLSETSELIIEI